MNNTCSKELVCRVVLVYVTVVLTEISFKVEVLKMVKRRQLFLSKEITWKGLNGGMVLDVGVSDMSYV